MDTYFAAAFGKRSCQLESNPKASDSQAFCLVLSAWALEKKGLKGGITPGKLMDAQSSAKQEAELIEKLGVTRL